VRILLIGDVVGRPGRRALAAHLPALRRTHGADFVIVNGENAAGGSGLTPKALQELVSAGADAVTTGDHIYKNKDVFACIGEDRLLRPLNYVPAAAGRGLGVYPVGGSSDESKDAARAPPVHVAVVNLIGRVFMNPAECPFLAVDRALEELSGRAQVVVVDMHAEATSEKVAMGWHLDGRVAVVAGTHTHVPTADARVLPGGTAYITDLGMTGSYDSVLGRDKESVIYHFTTAMPARFEVAKGDVRVAGAVVDVDASTGLARSIDPFLVEAQAARTGARSAKSDENPAGGPPTPENAS